MKALYVFGSMANGSSREQSDADFIVEFDRTGYEGAFEQFMGLKEALEGVLQRPVDLIANGRFRNPIFREEVEKSKKLVYAA